MGYQLLERKKFDCCYAGIILGVLFFFLINHGGLISYEEGIVQSSKCEPKPVLTTSRFKNYVFNSTLCYAWGVPYSVLCSKIA